MTLKKIAVPIIVIVLLFLLSFFDFSKSNSFIQDQTVNKDNMEQIGDAQKKDFKSPLDDLKLEENRSIYLQDEDSSVSTIYITILKSTDDSTGDLFSFEQLNNITDYMEEESPSFEVFFEEKKSTGSVKEFLSHGQGEANATIQLRGHSTRRGAQKSYKIKLFEQAGLWKEQRILNLNKHPFDTVRVRNKLSFDYFEIIPNMTSLRTQFVHLYVKDLSKKPNADFEDYGLYTHVEQPNKLFLKNHGLDYTGQLYKVENFEFYRYEEEIKTVDDKKYDKDKFEKRLEVKGSEDHSKLIKMLEDVNDYTLDINEVVEKHFDKENYLTWMASNILFGNLDTISQNYYLYSPINGNKWYFMPWDYDGSWKIEKEEFTADWQFGLSNYWSNVLHKRFFKDPNNVKALSEKIEYMETIINPQQTKAFLDSYYEVVNQYMKNNPDFKYLRIPIQEAEKEYKLLPNLTQINKKKYYENLEKPMPIFLGEPSYKEGKYIFSWDTSYDLQGDDLVYDFSISKDPNFSQIIDEEKELIDFHYEMESLPPGTYYWRVLVYDSKGNMQIAFDKHYDEWRNWHFGVKKFVVK